MDETLRELVSRHIDGDLDEAEAARLDERALTDGELAEEIEAGHTLRRAVAVLAGSMAPPATLDRVMEPLRTSAPAPTSRVRPVYRWLGAAATVVLGVTVAVEVARRNPEPTPLRPTPHRERPAQGREEIFKLAPLPTANPDERRPLGATDHLLEEEPALPSAPEPAPLEVMGPLPAEGSSTVADETLGALDSQESSVTERADMRTAESRPGPAETVSTTGPGASAGSASSVPSPAGLSRTDGDLGEDLPTLDAGKARAKMAIAGRIAPETPLVLRIEGKIVWSGGAAACADGTRPVRIEVRDGRVVSLTNILDETGLRTGDPDESCQPENLIGSPIVGVGDGVHLGEITAGDPSP